MATLQEKEAIINILSSICDDDSVKEAFWPLFGDDQTILAPVYQTNEDPESEEENQIVLEVATKKKKVEKVYKTKLTRNTVPNETWDAMKSTIHVSAHVVEVLIGYVSKWDVVPSANSGRTPVSAQKHVLILLWYLSTSEFLKQIATRFEVTTATVFRVLMRSMSEFNKHSVDFIKWCTPEECNESEAVFKESSGIPGVIGAVEAVHIPIFKSGEVSNNYLNKLDFYSVVVQLAARHDMRIISAFGCFPGGCPDNEVLEESSLFEIGQSGALCPPNMHIVADAAYPLSTWMVVPYIQNALLNNQQVYFNTQLAKVQSTMTHTVGVLRGRFPRLHYIHMKSLDAIRHAIITACVLHNICIDNGDDSRITLDEDGKKPRYLLQHVPTNEAAEKRDFLAGLQNY